jgi:hypothetical protein
LLVAAARRTVYALVTTYHPHRAPMDSALILSTDPLGAALVAAAAEVAGVRPLFSGPDEAPRTALRRVRAAVVLIAADAECLRDEAFLGPAKMTGARLIVFGRERHLDNIRDIVTRYALEVLVLPRDTGQIGSRLKGASESSPRPQESTAP